ncbi:betaine/proline/choline family ABC transporter ATP-binding protein [Streptomyces lacrimifluminis]|uniref:betaine/proline/choline family ABC transporter ATP-binding protein n=1 Tax=Streptomyces lacrimifluminis TaxID=1500077 RepID=UPI001E4B4925|nr:betaine/proline/choline family ABC transporter ATP-binding protein [Streptomyces lacrimifluminis]
MTTSETAGTGGHGATIELENLTKRYPGSSGPSVDNVSMEIRAGETVVFVGPSGCGKSTTLKMINRLIEPTGGRIRIGGEDVTDMDPVKLRRRIGYAIQSSGLFPHMTVAQNIALVPRMTGWPAGRVKARVEEMLDLVGLDPGEFHDRYPRQLSGGQQQRVGVARALAADPPVLLMDEPFGAVDPITRDHLQDELIRLQHELHRTIVFVTHDFDEAIKLGDRIAVLRERSHIAQFDTPEAILTNPADDFVSGFVGAGAALKRLNLTRVRNVEITDYPTVAVDDPLQEIFNKLRSSGTNEILLLDKLRRPYKWLRRGDLMRARGSLARAGTLVSDTVTRDATLRDALEAVLTDNAGRVAVTGRRGEYEGVVDMETLMNSVRELLEADRLEAAEARAELEAARTDRTHAEQEGDDRTGGKSGEVRA